MADVPQHQEIEDAFRWANEITGRLPESIETNRAKANLKIAEDYVHQARERVKSEPAPEDIPS